MVSSREDRGIPENPRGTQGEPRADEGSETAVDESIHLLEKEHGEQKAFLDENIGRSSAKTRLSDLHDKIKKIGEERALLEKREKS
jgi:hypothetical protein